MRGVVRNFVVWGAILVSSATAQPNIILILSDDAGYNEIGYTGDNDFLTPAIDSIAASGIRFSNAYVTQPVCGPSRAGLLTGLYQQRQGFEENPPRMMDRPEGLDPDIPTLADRLGALGYTTGAIGKWHLGSTRGRNTPNDLGFDEFFGMLSGARHYWGGETDEWNRIRRQHIDVESLWPFEGDLSRYDHNFGRYLTDAFGEEAVAFIESHANDSNPFFLYLSFSAPHKPYEAKQADVDMFPNLTGDKRTRAAMTLAMDRAIGDVLNALEANNIDQETIVVFLNDNGGTPDRDNSPFMGHKGLTWEGGIRVPFCVRWPGMPQDVEYGNPVISMDLVPTLITAAGGQVGITDGVDLAPFLLGNQQGNPHEMIYIRDRWEWAIRRGQWKLVRPDKNTQTVYLFNLDTDRGETINLRNDYPEIVDDLTRHYTAWEATVDKLRWTESGFFTLNQFDHFRSRLPTSNFKWSNSEAWFRESSQDIVTFKQHDSYANAILEFSTRSSHYIAENALPRMTGLVFMLHEYRFTDTTGSDSPFSGSLTGDSVVMVPSLAGEPPRITLDADATMFGFEIETPIEFLGTLTMQGNGQASLDINTPIVEYMPGQSISKEGTCAITFSDPLQCTGEITLNEGLLLAQGPQAQLVSDTAVRIGTLGTLHLINDARVVAPLLDCAGWLGGEGILRVEGDYTTTDTNAELGITLAGLIPGSGHDQLLVSGAAFIDSKLLLDVDLSFNPVPDDTFRIVQASTLSGEFDSIEVLPAGSHWRPQLLYDATGVTLRIGCSADLDDNGLVDTIDLLQFLGAWVAEDQIADWNSDGTIDSLDFLAFLNDWAACRS